MERKLPRNKRKYSELQSYKQQSDTDSSELFLEADDYPPFFNENLIDPDRTIKIFYNQPYSHQTIFYFQLLRLLYQTEQVDYQNYLVKIYDLLDNPQFQFVVPQEGSKYYLGMGQTRMRKMMQEFLEQLGEGGVGVEEILIKYPVMDKILTLFMRTILIMGDKCQSFEDFIEPVEIYEFLADYFQIQITYYTNCLRFNQSDLFVYFQSEKEIYLAYITPKMTEEEIASSSQFYQKDPQQAFNISSVKQMVSQIDIPLQQECFNITKHNQSLNETQFVDYDYSESQDFRRPSKSLHQNSDLKFSYLINDESSMLTNLNVIKSNKVLQKQVIGEKKNHPKIIWKNDNFFQIKEVPSELESISPVATPKLSRFASFGQEDAPDGREYVACIYEKNLKKKSKLSDTIKQDQNEMLSTGESDFNVKSKKQKRTWQKFKQQTQQLFNEDKQNQQIQNTQKQQKTLKSLYDMRSIQSIASCSDSISYVIDTPHKSSFNASFNPSFNPSRKPTYLSNFKKNEYTKFGYINNNLSNQFTNESILQEMQEPYRTRIEAIKLKARKERKNIQNMSCF